MSDPPEEFLEELEAENPEDYDVEYQKTKEHQILYANGAYGGITPRGDLAMDFFAEYPSRPESQKFGLDHEGNVTGQIDQEGGDTFIRKRLATIFLQPHNARSVAEWILSKVLGVDAEEIHQVIDDNFSK